MSIQITLAGSRTLLPARQAWLANFRPEKRLLTGEAYRVAKRIMDLVLVVLTLPVLLPLLGLCLLVIKLESPRNPALFVQVRTGKGGRPFRMYKFRTMVGNADEMKMTLAHL